MISNTLVLVMAWCRQATGHYLSQCWPISLSPYGVTRPQWVNNNVHIRVASPIVFQIAGKPDFNSLFKLPRQQTSGLVKRRDDILLGHRPLLGNNKKSPKLCIVDPLWGESNGHWWIPLKIWVSKAKSGSVSWRITTQAVGGGGPWTSFYIPSVIPFKMPQHCFSLDTPPSSLSNIEATVKLRPSVTWEWRKSCMYPLNCLLLKSAHSGQWLKNFLYGSSVWPSAHVTVSDGFAATEQMFSKISRTSLFKASFITSNWDSKPSTFSMHFLNCSSSHWACLIMRGAINSTS